MNPMCSLCYKRTSMIHACQEMREIVEPCCSNDLPISGTVCRKIYRHADHFTVSLSPEAALGYTDNEGDYFEARQVMATPAKVTCLGAQREREKHNISSSQLGLIRCLTLCWGQCYDVCLDAL